LGSHTLDDSIGKYLPNVDELHSRITIRHLLTQTSGLRFAWANDVMAGGVGNSVDYALALPFDHEPGSYFEYAQVTVSLLAAVVASAVGQPFAEFAQRNLFDPLGIADAEVAWATDAAGNTLGYAFAEATPRGARENRILAASQRSLRWAPADLGTLCSRSKIIESSKSQVRVSDVDKSGLVGVHRL
jgi:CubicO group peptidase (beta-lactamase class C family)